MVSSNNDLRIFSAQSQFTSMILISDLQWSEWIPLTVLTHQTRHLGCKGGGDGKQSEIKWRQVRVHPSFLKSSQRTMPQKIPICDRLFIAQETKTVNCKFSEKTSTCWSVIWSWDQFTVKQCYMVQKQKTDLLLIFQSSEVPDLVIMFFSQLC